MLSEVEKIKEAYNSSKTEETPAETEQTEQAVETPAETTQAEQAVETPAETEQVEQAEDKPDETAQDKPDEQEPPTPKKPKDTSMYTKEEKAQHAFKRQLAKQKEKFESQVAELTGSFKGSLDEIKKQVAELKEQKKTAEPAKTRADFASDDEYIAFLTNQGVSKALAERDAATAKENEKKAQEKAEADRVAREEAEVQEAFTGYCREAFPDENGFRDFSVKVDKALRNGLGEILDNAPAVRDYIFSHAEGPLVLNEMLTNRESFVRIMKSAGNPLDAAIEMHDLLREVRERGAAPSQEQPRMPHLGKPGAASAASGAGGGSNFNLKSDDDVINYLRSRAR